MAFEKLEGIVAVFLFRTKHDQQIEDDLCILNEIGWVDDDLAAINETIVEDMNSFPENISAALTGEVFDQCIEKVKSLGSKSGSCHDCSWEAGVFPLGYGDSLQGICGRDDQGVGRGAVRGNAGYIRVDVKHIIS